MINPEDTRSLAAELNDLLKLDRDAVDTYSVAIDALENDGFRETLKQFRGDHDRHVVELTSLIRAAGGTPSESGHVTTRALKQALQQICRMGGDRGILSAFEVNERQVRDKYWRYADQLYPPSIRGVIRRGAEDEDRHWTWANEVLKRTGADPLELPPLVQEVLAQIHGRTDDLLEAVEREVDERLENRDREF
jgi:uncharacterized protein (TIGR02284 family)